MPDAVSTKNSLGGAEIVAGLTYTVSAIHDDAFYAECARRLAASADVMSRLREMGFFVPDECFAALYRRYCGDFLELGKGEILIRASN